jgi:anaphase-promoting complex subunit 1
MVNTSITAPGAIVALALIYLKSNNKQIADMIKIPHTFEALDFVTPQTTILKVIARNLVLWDSIECTSDWVDKQIPELIRYVFYCENERDVVKKYSNRININDIDFL